MRWRSLASPTAAMWLLSTLVLIVGKTGGWSNGAVGSAIVGIVAATIVAAELFSANGTRRRLRRPR